VVRALVVDDEERLATAVARGLSAEGFDVDVAYNGLDGLWRAREHTYSVIVLDLLMPGMNGYEVCRELRKEGNATPILVLTAKDGEYDEAEALDTGADDFLSKPFSFVVLVARVRALLRRARALDGGELEVGSLRLDTRRRRCWRESDEIKLTPREFAVLERLMRNVDVVCSKDEIMAEVWGPDYVGAANVVEVYVRYLRRKIDVPYGTTTLETVRGSGYRVVAHA
jgi:two-component system OmpR family response regulator